MKTESVFKVVGQLQIGDKVHINDWVYPMDICGVSDHFVLAYNNKSDEYTIISKTPNPNTYNNVQEGCCYCGPDYWSMGYWSGYHFNDTKWVEEYLNSLETNETEISQRNRAAIYLIKVMQND